MIKVAHTADLHSSKKNMDKLLLSLSTLRDSCEEEGVDLIAIAGDIWDAGMYATGASRFPELIESIRSLADVAPVVMIYGTPSHDLPGSLDVFPTLSASHSITVLKPGVPYFLENLPYDADVSSDAPNGRLLILGIPEPSKDWLLAGKPPMGREESDNAMKEGMRSLLLGLAAHRKEHLDTPCLVLYHGQIRGATMQNGQVIENAIGRDDLAQIGADYYALGDIHEPQQIGKLSMYYPGSAYPQNWGETHQAGFNMITILPKSSDATGSERMLDFEVPQMNVVTVERRDYPHPRRMKIETVHGSNGVLPEMTGRLVWHEITAPKGASIDTDALTRSLMAWGALEGSKVTVKTIPTETVRAGEIAEKRRLRDKVRIWTENSSAECAESVYEKADELEELRENTHGETAHHWRIKRLSLRGAIGTWKGLGVDDVELNLDEYDEGIIALVGSNGKGKSTLFENMQPWPQLMTREGTLSSHFRLRDSHRDLYLVDERTGDEYRFFIQINGATKTGGAEYHVYRNGVPYGDSNGRRDPYVEAVTELFGTLEMYQRSAFVSQRPTKGNPDLADATKGERKTLFRELAGLEYLQEYADRAKARAKSIEDSINEDVGWITATEAQLETLPQMRARVPDLETKARQTQSQVEQLADHGRQLREKHDALAVEVEKNRSRRQQVNDLNDRVEKLEYEQDEKQPQVNVLRRDLEGREDAERRIRYWEELEDDRQKVEAKRNERLAERAAQLEQYNAARETYDRDRRSLEKEKSAAQDALADLRRRREAAAEGVRRVSELLDRPRHDTCPDCGAALPWAEDEEAERQRWAEEREQQQRTVWQIDSDLPQAEELVERANSALVALEEPERPEQAKMSEDDELERIGRDQAFYNVEEARETVRKAEAATSRIESMTERLSQIETELAELLTKRDTAKAGIDDAIDERYTTMKAELEQTRSDHADLREQSARYASELDSFRKQIAGLEDLESELKERRQAVYKKRDDAEEWAYLQKACGPDGIQALELDALAPSISDVANGILESAYGARFIVQFQTTKMSSDGKKQLEDFLIQVYDTEHGTEQELSTLSGGESVWIKRAIYDAFGIIRDRNTGLRFLTSFQDETDGALDPEAKEAYARMLHAAHKQAGRSHTILITHSREVQELVGQRIEMDELARVKEAVPA